MLILNLVMPTPRVLPISPRCSHCTVILSEQPQRESAVHWSKACSSVWHARMGCGHHQHGLSGTAKGCQHRQRAPFSCQSLRGWIWGILDPPSGLDVSVNLSVCTQLHRRGQAVELHRPARCDVSSAPCAGGLSTCFTSPQQAPRRWPCGHHANPDFCLRYPFTVSSSRC